MGFPRHIREKVLHEIDRIAWWKFGARVTVTPPQGRYSANSDSHWINIYAHARIPAVHITKGPFDSYVAQRLTSRVSVVDEARGDRRWVTITQKLGGDRARTARLASSEPARLEHLQSELRRGVSIDRALQRAGLRLDGPWEE